MNLGSQSISNQSQNFNDYRYQKALKQISKLIGVNRQLKLESEKYRSEIEQINDRYEQLLQMTSNLQNQVQTLRNEVHNLNNILIERQSFIQKISSQQQELLKHHQNFEYNQLQQQQKYRKRLIKLENDYKKQIDELVEQIKQKSNHIIHLQQKSQYIYDLQTQNHKLHQQYQQIVREADQLTKQLQHAQEEMQNMSIQPTQKPNQDLLNKLKINQQWIKSLNEQNYTLKQKFLQDQYLKKKQKCNETIFKNTSHHDMKSLLQQSPDFNTLIFKQYLKSFQKRYKKIEQQLQKYTSKYKHMKQKASDLQISNIQYGKQIQLLKVQVHGYEKLTQRQQRELEHTIEQFNQEMDRVVKSVQLHPDRHPLEYSPSASMLNQKEQLKQLIQALQNDINSTKTQVIDRQKIIQFLEIRVKTLQIQQQQIRSTVFQLQRELDSFRNTDLSKTKNYGRQQSLMRTQTLSKNGRKLFIMNDKSYQSRLLKHTGSQTTHQQDKQQLVIEQQPPRRPNIFHSGQLSYSTQQRNYGNNGKFNVSTRI